MMSLSQFRSHLFQTFALMRDTKVSIDVYHRRKVYRVHIEETGERVTKPYRKKRQKHTIPNAMLDTIECETCGSMRVNGVCMNRDCPSL
jgi:hypothetical protein